MIQYISPRISLPSRQCLKHVISHNKTRVLHFAISNLSTFVNILTSICGTVCDERKSYYKFQVLWDNMSCLGYLVRTVSNNRIFILSVKGWMY
jgi:hypothetical protein